MEEKKNLEMVSGDGSELNISQVHDNLTGVKPKSASKKPTNIIIPKEKNNISKENEGEEN